jgi:hypothetical protein
MSVRISVLAGVLTIGTSLAASVFAQPPAASPKWTAAHDLKVRKGKETDLDKAPKLGVEIFEDSTTSAFVLISSAGNLAVAPKEATPNKKTTEKPFGNSLSVRTASEKEITDKTLLLGVDFFKGLFAGHLFYMTERSGMALYKSDALGGKAAEHQYGLTLRVRKPGQASFGPDAKAFGLEAYKDTNTGGMIYVTEGGMLAMVAAVPEKTPDSKEVKKPKPLYGLEAKVRKADEANFNDKTQKIGIEVFKDENTGTLIYISDTGSIAAVPPPAEVKTEQKLSWMHAMTLKARPGAEQDFAKSRKFGVEVFTDKHTGYTLYVCETGSIAVLAK